MSEAYPLISCICVTRKRPELLKKALTCFQAQTYPNLEVIIACDRDDPDTPSLVSSFMDPRMVLVVGPPPPIMLLGAKRNHAIAKARGEYLAVWDDDDWYDADRLSMQYDQLRSQGKDACVISPIVMCDVIRQKAYLGNDHLWENTLLAKKQGFPPYPELAKGEDTPVVAELVRRNALTVLSEPSLYVYVFHGINTWDFDHWEKNLLPLTTPLPKEDTQEVLIAIGVIE